MKKTTKKKTTKKKTAKKRTKSEQDRMRSKILAAELLDAAKLRAQAKKKTADARQKLNLPRTPKSNEKVTEDVAKIRAANTGPDQPKPEPAVVEHRQQCISFVWVRNTDLQVGDSVFDPGDQAGSFTNPKFAEVHQVVIDDKSVHVWVSYERETKRRTWSVDKDNWMPIKYRGGPIDTRTTRYKCAAGAYSQGHPTSQGHFQV